MLIQEVRDEPDDVLVTYILVSISLALVLVTSIYNFFQTPNSNIFINYEEFMHQSLQKYFGELNSTNKNGLRFTVSSNDINWIEVSIPKNLQMPFSEYQVKRHLDILHKKALEEGLEDTHKLVAVVETQEEAD